MYKTIKNLYHWVIGEDITSRLALENLLIIAEMKKQVKDLGLF